MGNCGANYFRNNEWMLEIDFQTQTEDVVRTLELVYTVGGELAEALGNSADSTQFVVDDTELILCLGFLLS